jgi:hypothetical protein
MPHPTVFVNPRKAARVGFPFATLTCVIALGVSAMADPDSSNLLYEAKSPLGPDTVGWTYLPSANPAGKPVWIESEGYYQDKGGRWTGPRIACTADPFQFYRLDFTSKAEANGYYAVFFQDKDGQDLVSDIYASVYSSQDWEKNTVCFRGREGGVTFTVNFIGTRPILVRDIKVATATKAEVCQWADRLCASLPPLDFVADPGRWTRLPRTLRRLRDGGALRIVMLGDSIINDTNNSNYDALLMRMYPQAEVRVVCSVRGGTGCWHYQDDAQHKAYVLDLAPDLLMIGGISHRQDLAAIRQVIRKTKAQCDGEILLMSGPMAQDWRPWDEKNPGQPLATTTYPGDEFNGQMKRLAAEEGVEFLDMNTPWHEYLAASGKPHEWFHRDLVHANDRGKQVLARILERYFAPKR